LISCTFRRTESCANRFFDGNLSVLYRCPTCGSTRVPPFCNAYGTWRYSVTAFSFPSSLFASLFTFRFFTSFVPHLVRLHSMSAQGRIAPLQNFPAPFLLSLVRQPPPFFHGPFALLLVSILVRWHDDGPKSSCGALWSVPRKLRRPYLIFPP